MISGFSNERVSYRTRYLNFPSTMAENVPSISKPTVHVVKIRFNNIFKNEKVLFAAIAVSLSVLSLIAGIALYSIYRDVIAEDIIAAPSSVAMEELKSISDADAGMTIMNKSSLGNGMAGSQQGGNYLSYNNGGGVDPNSMLLASNENSKPAGKEVLTSKRAVVDIDDKMQVNPFLPVSDIVETKTVKKVVAKPNPNFILPPTSVGTDSTASILLKTSVAGIMYDTYSPSAIVNIDGVDYLVKKGDNVQGYNILNIEPKYVSIKLDKNIFRAPVGIILARLDSQNNTDTYKLNQRFGGNTAGSARRKIKRK